MQTSTSTTIDLATAPLTLLDAPLAPATTLADAYAVIQRSRFVDLTHTFGPDIPHWKDGSGSYAKDGGTLLIVAVDKELEG
jgi:hypothetical protein